MRKSKMEGTTNIKNWNGGKIYLLTASQIDQIQLPTQFLLCLCVFLLHINQEDTVTPRAVLIHVWREKNTSCYLNCLDSVGAYMQAIAYYCYITRNNVSFNSISVTAKSALLHAFQTGGSNSTGKRKRLTYASPVNAYITYFVFERSLVQHGWSFSQTT